MTQAKPKFYSFEDYLSYADGTEKLYELFNGELIEVPPESGKNTAIAVFLLLKFVALIGHLRVRPHGLELEVRGEPRNRYPDLTLIQPEHIQQLEQRNTLCLSMAPPLLVVEVVSPGDLQRDSPLATLRDRDYIAKRMQYQDRQIPEYWIIDPQLETVLILELTEGIYTEVNTFRGNDQIHSPQFPGLLLTAIQILTAGD